MHKDFDNSIAAPAQPGQGGHDRIVVVGAACRFAGADSLEQYWSQLLAGSNCASKPERWATRDGQEHRGGFLSDIAGFDAPFFRLSPNEARCMDPQQRLLMEVAHHAIEHAGLTAQRLRQLQCGVFCTSLPGDYKFLLGQDPALAFSTYSFSGNAASSLSGRISYFYDWHGPSITLDTACSSSLTALQIACLQLREGACNAALVGAVSAFATPELFEFSQRSNMLSRQGRCAAFGAAADGFVPAEGVAAVLLMRQSQAVALGLDMLGVIEAVALNHDGQSNGLMAPNGKAQGELIEQMYARHGIGPDQVGYVEAHGTGTPLGDPIEMAGLVRAYRAPGRPYRCYLGSAKSVIGHSLVTSGLASLIKTMLVLRHGVIPPHPLGGGLNPELELDQFELNAQAEPWPEGKQYAAISAFGFTGSNAHLVLSRPDNSHLRRAARAPAGALAFLFSAQSPFSLAAKLRQHLQWLEREPAPDLGALSVALGRGGENYRMRLAVVAAGAASLRAQLQHWLALDPQQLALAAGSFGGSLDELGDALQAATLRRWLDGASVALYPEQVLAQRSSMTLPPYPFERKRYWVGAGAAAGPAAAPAPDPVAPVLDKLRQKIADLLGFSCAEIDPSLPLRDYGIDSISVIGLLAEFGAAAAGLQPHTIFEFPSVSAFAAALAGAAQAPAPVVAGAAAPPAAARPIRWSRTPGAAGRPILLLPPLNMSAQAWIQQLAFLRRHGYAPQVAIYPGHADNAHPAASIAWPALVAALIADMREHFGGQPVPVLGWSLGGCLALAVAQQAPELMSSMVLISTAARFQDDLFGKTIDLNAELEGYADYLSILLEPKRSVVEQVSAGANMEVLARYYGMLAKFDCSAALEQVSVPSLIVHGGRDAAIGAADLALLRRLRGARVVEMEELGHFVPLVAPARFNPLMLEFVNATQH